MGIDGYPVFTRKASTDVSYLACARAMLADRTAFFPMFATHNAHTLAAVKTMAGAREDYEFQRLHGMGEELYDQASARPAWRQCRIYAPVGAHEDLLAYLVRRLLENGANTSFVNRLADDEAPIEAIIADPVDQVEAMNPKTASAYSVARELVRRPQELARRVVERSGASRAVGEGDCASGARAARRAAADRRRRARRQGGGRVRSVEAFARKSAAWSTRRRRWRRALAPRRRRRSSIGMRWAAQKRARDSGTRRRSVRARRGVADRAVRARGGQDDRQWAGRCARGGRFLALLCGAGAGGIRGAESCFPGPTGERNELSLHGRGVFAAISPWNFPVAIFTGQIAGALAAGNTRRCQARRADAADRLCGDAAAA